MKEPDEQYMRMALKLAALGRGMTSPNPMVGAVIVKRGRVVGKAYHQKAGTPHAEALALQQAGPSAKGSTLYVNLEPCCHQAKRTPPCTAEIVRRGVQRVVIGATDPNPRVCGRGMALLEDAGIEVTSGLLEDASKQLNEVYFKHTTKQVPFVILKTASSLDGKIAVASGESQWITGDAARRQGHRLRATVDAVMVGIGTVQQDDPQLTVRGIRRAIRPPLRIVIDGRLRISERSRVLSTEEAPTLIVTTSQAPADKVQRLRKRGVDVWTTASGPAGRVKLQDLMKALGQKGITSLLIEGGSALNASALQARIVDKVVFFIAPKLIGGRDAIASIGGDSPKSLDLAIPLRDVRVRRVGEDLMVEGYISWRPTDVGD